MNTSNTKINPYPQPWDRNNPPLQNPGRFNVLMIVPALTIDDDGVHEVVQRITRAVAALPA